VRLKIATKRLLDDSDKEENGGGFHFKLSAAILVKPTVLLLNCQENQSKDNKSYAKQLALKHAFL